MVSVDHLRLDKLTGDRLEGHPPRLEHPPDLLDRLIDDPPHLLIDLAGRLLAVRPGSREIPAASGEERRAVAFAEVHPPHPAHAVFHDHRPGDPAGPFEVVLGPSRDVGVDHLLGDRPAEEHLDPALEFALGEEVAVILGALHRVAEGGEAAGDDRDLVNGIGVGERKGHQRVGRFVVGDTALLVLVDDPLLLLEPGRHPLDPLVELLHADGGLVVAGREERRLVDEIGQISATEARGDPRDLLEVDGGIELHTGDVDLEDLLSATDIGAVDEHMAVEAPRPEEGRIERLGAVGRRHHDHAAVGPEAVHLDQQRIERLLALVMAADDARAAGLAEGVELVDEDDAGGLRLGLLKHVADTGRTDADEHLDEVAAGEAKERHPRLPRDGLG